MKIPPLQFFILLLLAVGNSSKANEPAVEPLKASTSDVLKFLNAHAWKWTYHAPTPYKKITVRLVLFTRTPDGEFKRERLLSNSSSFSEARASDDIFIACGSRGDHATFLVSFGHGTSGPNEQPGILMKDYSRSGSGDGGVPWKIGAEYMLLTKFKDTLIK